MRWALQAAEGAGSCSMSSGDLERCPFLHVRAGWLVWTVQRPKGSAGLGAGMRLGSGWGLGGRSELVRQGLPGDASGCYRAHLADMGRSGGGSPRQESSGHRTCSLGFRPVTLGVKLLGIPGVSAVTWKG